MMFRRMLRAAKLDVSLYEEVEADQGATIEAMGVVLLSDLAVGIGMISTMGGIGFVGGAIAALVRWVVWAFLIFVVGTKLLPEPQTQSNMGELLRTIGFSSSPGLICAFGIFHPALAVFLGIASTLWMLVAMVIAVRQALDYQSTGRAIGVVLIGGLVGVLVFGGLYALIVGMTAGPGAP